MPLQLIFTRTLIFLGQYACEGHAALQHQRNSI